MGKLQFVFISVLIALVSFSCLTPKASGQATTVRQQLPDPRVMKLYVKNLIETYNMLVEKYDKPRSDFDEIKPYFSLYQEPGISFEVIVVWTDPNYPNQITLIFIPIQANRTNVIMDTQHTWRSLFPNETEWFGFGPIIRQSLPFTCNDTLMHPNLVLGIQASDVSSNNYVTTSADAANSVYQNDQNQAVPTISQTQTTIQIINQTQTTTTQSPNWPVAELMSITNDVIAGIIVAVLLAIVGVWKHKKKRIRGQDDLTAGQSTSQPNEAISQLVAILKKMKLRWETYVHYGPDIKWTSESINNLKGEFGEDSEALLKLLSEHSDVIDQATESDLRIIIERIGLFRAFKINFDLRPSENFGRFNDLEERGNQIFSILYPLLTKLEGVRQKEKTSGLPYRAAQLTKPVQDIHGNLTYGPRLIPEAVSIFEREIENKGLLQMLRQDSPGLAESIQKAVVLLKEIEARPPTPNESMIKGLSPRGDNAVLRIRLDDDEKARQLVKNIQKDIEDLLAKYGGF
jgi:hypothetical protein